MSWQNSILLTVRKQRLIIELSSNTGRQAGGNAPHRQSVLPLSQSPVPTKRQDANSPRVLLHIVPRVFESEGRLISQVRNLYIIGFLPMLSHQIHPAFVLQLVLQNCKLPYQIVLHSLGHLLCRAVTIVDGAV